jgi:DNA end-binding protein Ku
MARAVWSGALSFGLVNVPVKAYAAVRDHAVHFHQLEKRSGARIRNRKVSDKSGRSVEADHIEMGYELKSGKYVVVDPGELEALRPDQTRAIAVSDFVELEAIDPIFYAHTYWLAPDGKAASHAYGLLLAAMIEQGRVGIGTVVMRNKQYLAAIRPFDRGLAMSTMRFADEVVPASDVSGIPARRVKADPKEIKLATQIIDALASDWDPKRYHDTYTESLRDLIEQKSKGKDIVWPEEHEAPESNVVDLMAALEASVAKARSRRGATRSKARSKATKRSASSKRKSA